MADPGNTEQKQLKILLEEMEEVGQGDLDLLSLKIIDLIVDVNERTK